MGNKPLLRFLIEGPRGTVLHTGDFRAEPCFLDSITRNPYLQPYLAQPLKPPKNSEHVCMPPVKTLETIYLDTASLLSTMKVPTKVCVYLYASCHVMSYPSFCELCGS